MKRYITLILAALMTLLAAGGCVREEFRSGGLAEGEGWLTLQFGSSDNVEIQTRATLNHASENRVLNAYLFLFDSGGNKVYGKWFGTLEKVESDNAVLSAGEDCWYVKNATSSGEKTTGSIKIKAPAGTGFRLYLLTNLDADMVRVSSDVLAHNIDSEADLKKFPVYLNQETVSRNGYFPMSGNLSDIDIADGGSTSGGELNLTRLDAKVRFIFKAGDREDERGQTIKSFTAKQWRVINVPRTSNMMAESGIGKDAGAVDPATGIDNYPEHAPDFFDSSWTNFEDFTAAGTSEFSFYMLENRQTPKAAPATYQDRSRQIKLADGHNKSTSVTYTNPASGKQESRSMRIFQNANDFSTYVLVSGRVEMKLENDDAGQTLAADVQYLIHLGDWTQGTSGSSWSSDQYSELADYNICRNTSYTYTVTINSVNNIRVEVETSGGDVSKVEENQPGASGLVTIAKEEIALCDAHYTSKTMTFHAKNFLDANGNSVADELTWSVKTPYCDGMPTYGPNGEDIPDGLDYKWVRFRLNKKDDAGNYYSDKRRKYTPRVFTTSSTERTAEENKEDDDGTPGLAGKHNDGCMDIRGLVKYIKEQADKYEKDLEYGTHNSDFDNGGLGDGTTDPLGPKICVTAFVDEFYYEKNPITGVTSPTLWKEFVNQPDRTMHILCNSQVSKDGESRATGSVITIQQKSIQTIYNTDPSINSLTSAWGLEFEDEYPEIWEFPQASGIGNDSNSNGLLNSAKLWGLNSGNSFQTKRWDTFMDFEVDNDTPQLNDSYKNLRYSCLTRNRDLNGDGVIDRDEIRWYTASINQLIGLYIGDGLVDPKSRLYNRSAEEQASSTASDWMQHVASSTVYNNSGHPTIVWAEEGIATGSGGDDQEGAGKMTVRCVRNLGLSADGELTDEPQDYIQQSSDKLTFTNTYLNHAALRYYTSRELDLHNQNAEENRLYKKFEVYSTKTSYGSNVNFVDLNKNVTSAIDKGEDNPYCPAGYRLPNQRELAIMKYYGVLDNTVVMSRTGYSFGNIADIGSNKVQKSGFSYSGGNITLNVKASANAARCVRDIRTD